MPSRTILTHLVDGNPEGIKIVRFSNRSIRAVHIPRSLLNGALSSREELKRSGVYFLFGEKENGEPTVYIGQAIALGERLKSHVQDPKKQFFVHAICFTTNGDLLDSAEINYLEGKSIERIRNAGRIQDENGTRGNKEHVDEFKISDMEEYLDDIEILLSHMGYPVFVPIVPTGRGLARYHVVERGSEGYGYLTEEGFTVLAGSRGPKEMQSSVIKNNFFAYRNRPKLLDQGIIKEEGDAIVFLKDYLFGSPSSAADFIAGGSYNGWDVWKNDQGKTLHEVERLTLSNS